MNISDKYKLIFFHLPKSAGKSVNEVLGVKTSDKTNIESGLKQTILLGTDLLVFNKKMYPEKWEEYIKFTIVRNPWDRLVSLYHFRKKENDLYKLFPPGFGMNMLGGDKAGPDGEEWDFKRWILSSYIKGLTVDRRAMDTNLPMNIALSLDSKNLETALKHHRFFIEHNNYQNLLLSKDSIPTTDADGKIHNSIGYTLFIRDRIEWWNQIDIISDAAGEKLVDYILRFEHLEEMWNKMFEELGHKPPKLPKKNVSKHKHYSEYYDYETREFVGKLFERDIKVFGYEFERI